MGDSLTLNSHSNYIEAQGWA